MDRRELGTTGLMVSPIGFGAFKIGRNVGTKYGVAYELPSDGQVAALVDGLVAAGVSYFDTAPAYGSSEARLGAALAAHREVVVSTKVGETFEDGRSRYDFSAAAIRESVQRSRRRLRRERLDVVLIHSDGRDRRIMESTDAVATLRALKAEGLVRAIGLSGKTVEGARAALEWADVLMVEYNAEDASHGPVIREAAAAGVGVVVKKGLASGHLDAARAIAFVLGHPGVDSLVIGGLSLDHMRANIAAAARSVQ